MTRHRRGDVPTPEPAWDAARRVWARRPDDGKRGQSPAEASRRPGLPEVAMWLQSTAGNARAVEALGVLRQPGPGPGPDSAPPSAQTTTLVRNVADFATPAATLGGVGVRATGRLVVSGKATIADPKLPAKASGGILAAKASELITTALKASTPTGSGVRLEVSLAGKPLVLELSAAPAGAAFQVTAHFEAKADALSVPGVDVAAPKVVLDATFWIAPPAPAPAPAPAGGPAPPAPGRPGRRPPARRSRRALRPGPPLRRPLRPPPRPPRRRRPTPP